MCWYKMVVAGLLTLTAISLIAFPCRGEQHGPTVAIDIETSPVPDISSIDSVYSGSADHLYAFLVVDDILGGYLSGYDLGFELTSPDSSVVNTGFHLLPGWVGLDHNEQGFPEDMHLPGQRTPAAVGYWTLSLRKGAESKGRLRITPNPENLHRSVVLADLRGLLIDRSKLCVGHINISPHNPGNALPSGVQRTALNCLGKPVIEVRNNNHALGQVIAMFVPGTIELPSSQQAGNTDHVYNEAVRDVMTRFGIQTIERLYRNVERGGSEVVSLTGFSVKLLDTWDVFILHFSPESDIWEIVDALRELPKCEFAEPNSKMRLYSSPNDYYCREPRRYQRSIFRTQATAAYDMEVGEETIRIGIIDDGVGYAHPDLGEGFGPGCKVIDGWDYTDNDPDPASEYFDPEYRHYNHGTSVAGVAAALTNNHIGVAGVAGGWGEFSSGCSIVALRCALDDTHIDLAKAINAVSESYQIYGSQVVNASWGGPQYSEALRGAIFNAHAAGVVFVAAKGYIESGDPHDQSYPCDYDYDWVICVGASTMAEPPYERRVHFDDTFFWASDYGYGLDVLAPADDISVYTTGLWFPDTRYDYCSAAGTSMAAPQVSGIAGLLRSDSLSLCVDDIEGLICASCADIITDADGADSLFGYDEWSGWGRVCADSVMRFLRPPWMLEHHSVEGASYVAAVDTIYPFIMFGPDRPEPPYGVYWKVRRLDVRKDITYPSGWCAVRAWGRGYNATTGWSAANPNYMEGFCRVVEGSRTLTGCQLQTFVYLLFYYDPFREEWIYYGVYPTSPSGVDFQYTVLGCPGQGSVTPGDAVVSSCWIDHLTVTPNPVSGAARMAFTLGQPGNVAVSIYSIDGRLIRRLWCPLLDQGRHEVMWDGANDAGEVVSPGVYSLSFEVGGEHLITKVVIVR
ncbi:MAG: S8 family serine peptidase [Candidatus Eisenbacteria bacterium]